MNMQPLIDDLNVEGIILYGSHARKDHNQDSDEDFCVVVNKIGKESNLRVSEESKALFKKEGLLPAIYSLQAFEDMASSGSIFLWHIKQEGKLLFDRSGLLNSCLERLSSYSNLPRDLVVYENLLNAVESAIQMAVLLDFELAQLSTVARNICMAFCLANNQPVFSRSDCFFRAREIIGVEKFPLEESDYFSLEKWKLSFERGLPRPLTEINMIDVKRIIEGIRRLLAIAKEYEQSNKSL